MAIGTATTYPSVLDCMNLARSLVNDTLAGATGTSGEGQILTDNAPFTVPFLNSAIRWLYRKLGNNGVATVIQDNYILTGLGPVNGPLGSAEPDPSVQVNISYSGYFDGTTIDTTLKLPQSTLSVLLM
jgi:hypothetical protein